MNNKECLERINYVFDNHLKNGLLNLEVKWLIERAEKTERYENAIEQIVDILEGQNVTPLVESLALVLSHSGIYEKEKEENAMTSSKLDVYDYVVLPGVIRIGISGISDSILVDILSEIQQVDGRIHVEGVYYKYLDYELSIKDSGSHLDLKVVAIV